MPALTLSRRFGGLGSAFWSLQLGLFLNRAGQFVQPLLTFWLTTAHGLSITQAGAVVSVYGLGSTLGTTLGGVVADRMGRRATMLLSSVGSAGMLLALSQATAVWQIVPGALLLALVYDLHRPAVQAMVADVVPVTDRIRAYALTYVTVNLGFAIAPALAGWLATYSYTWVFLAAAAVQVLWAVFVTLRIVESKPAPVAGEAPGSLLDVLRDRVYMLFLGAMALAALIPHQGFVALSAWMKHEGYAASTFGTVIGLNGLLIVLVQPFVAEAVGRRDPVRMFTLATILQGIGFAMHGLGIGLVGHVAAVCVWTTGEIIFAPVASAVVAKLAPAQLRGRYQGMLGMSFSSASMLGPVLGAAALDAWGRTMWLGCFGVGLVSAAAMVALGPALRGRLAR